MRTFLLASADIEDDVVLFTDGLKTVQFTPFIGAPPTPAEIPPGYVVVELVPVEQ